MTWTHQAISKLEALTDQETSKNIMCECACHYPDSELSELREEYQESGNLKRVHSMLKTKFIRFLESSLQLNVNDVNFILL